MADKAFAARGAVLAAQLGLGAAVVLGWEFGGADEFFFSQPSDIAVRIVEWFASGSIWDHLGITLTEAALALVIGTTSGLVAGFSLARFRFLGAVFDPFIKVLNAVPRVVLAPIFLLGAWLGGGRPSLALGLAFLAVHAGIYGGMTAFNSYYDHDRGPIGFMKHPQAANRPVRDGALAIQGAGVIALLLISPPAAVPAPASSR